MSNIRRVSFRVKRTPGRSPYSSISDLNGCGNRLKRMASALRCRRVTNRHRSSRHFGALRCQASRPGCSNTTPRPLKERGCACSYCTTMPSVSRHAAGPRGLRTQGQYLHPGFVRGGEGRGPGRYQYKEQLETDLPVRAIAPKWLEVRNAEIGLYFSLFVYRTAANRPPKNDLSSGLESDRAFLSN